MRRFILFLSILVCLGATSCARVTPAATPPLVTAYSTAAAQPWLRELYDCAGTAAIISRLDDPASADIVLRVGEPEFLLSPAFQIDTEEILIVTHRQSPVQNLTLEEARALFEGRGDPSVQVWAYSPGADIQQVFDRVVMQGRRLMPSALLAGTPEQMSDTLVNVSNAVGILPRHWKVGDARQVFSVATVPVLAMTQGEPAGVVRDLVACLQT